MSSPTFGEQWLRSLPEPWPTGGGLPLRDVVERLATREAAALDMLARADATWCPIKMTDVLGHHATFWVSSDALMVAGLRMSVSHRTAELVARTRGCHLLTALLADEVHRQAAVKVPPRTQTPGPRMASADAIVRHSEACDAAIGPRAERHELTSGTGKYWVNTAKAKARPGRAWNYGWHAAGAPSRAVTPAGGRLWQPLAGAHELGHVDYSQTLRILLGTCEVDGVERPTAEVARSPELWRLLSHEGPLELYHPQVEGEIGEADTEPPPPEEPKSDTDVVIPWWTDGPHAANYYPAATRRGTDLIVIHSSEAAEKPYTAESLARWAAGKSGPAPRASWHWAVDNDSAVRCCPEPLVAWHANGANKWAIGIEHAGYAKQTRGEWLDDYSAAMLELSARVVGELLAPRFALPLVRVPIDALRRALLEVRAGRTYPAEARGLCAHSDLVKAGWGGCHGDPGPGFPWDVYLARCQVWLKG